MPLDDLPPTPVVFVPEVRDYHRINAELVGLLDAGHRRVRLDGADGQRLIASGLRGRWEAVVEVKGRIGPELAAGLDAPGLTILCHDSTADGLASTMLAGRVVVLGDSAHGAGYGLVGGEVLVRGSVGHRAGLNQSGGTIKIFGSVGRLAGDRQVGGRLFVPKGQTGPHLGRGRTGGELVEYLIPDNGDSGGCDDWLKLRDELSDWSLSLESPGL